MPDPNGDPVITGKPIPLDARLILIDIMLASGVRSCEITSVARTPADQARVMYDNCAGSGPQQGPVNQRSLYKLPGQVVVDVFEQNRMLPRDQVIALMLAKILELGPQTVSRHCCDPAKVTVFDIGPSSVKPQEARPALEAAARADKRVVKFLSPHNADPAYHFEIPVVPTGLPS